MTFKVIYYHGKSYNLQTTHDFMLVAYCNYVQTRTISEILALVCIYVYSA